MPSENSESGLLPNIATVRFDPTSNNKPPGSTEAVFENDKESIKVDVQLKGRKEVCGGQLERLMCEFPMKRATGT